MRATGYLDQYQLQRQCHNTNLVGSAQFLSMKSHQTISFTYFDQKIRIQNQSKLLYCYVYKIHMFLNLSELQKVF